MDELDRCRPSFAVEMLERIKHYFEDDRIIVVVSVNKDQLIHTIGNYYGQGFDATRYLNKFFDENIDLPEIDDYSKRVIQSYSTNKKDKFFLSKLADQLGEYYRLSIREVLIFRSRIENVPKQLVNYRHREGCFVSLFVACMILLDIVDVKEKRSFRKVKVNLWRISYPKLNVIGDLFSTFSATVVERNKRKNLKADMKKL